MRQIDNVVFSESQGDQKLLYTFDIGKFDNLVEEDPEEGDDLKGLTEGNKSTRIIGDFILHESFNDELLEDEGIKEQYRNLSRINKVFV